MRKKIEVQETNPTVLTLGDMLANIPGLLGDVELINECNETLLIASYVEDNVCPLFKVLSKELLDRKIINYGVRDGRALFKVEGVEDAV